MTSREYKYHYEVKERKDWFFNVETKETEHVTHRYLRRIKKSERRLRKAVNDILNDKDLRQVFIDVVTLPTLQLI